MERVRQLGGGKEHREINKEQKYKSGVGEGQGYEGFKLDAAFQDPTASSFIPFLSGNQGQRR